MPEVPTFLADADRIQCAFAGTLAVNKGDVIWQDTATIATTAYAVAPASSMLYSLLSTQTKAGAQAYLAPRFVGIAADQRAVGQTRADPILVDTNWIGPVTVTSGTYYMGDLLASKQNGGATALTNNTFEKVTNPLLAIGQVLRDSGASATTVLARFSSRVIPAQPSVTTGNQTLSDPANFVLGTSTGTQLGTGSTQKLGFWGATAVIQPASGSQAAVVAGVGSNTSVTMTTIANAVGTNAGWGWNTQAQFNTDIAKIDAAVTDLTAYNTQLNLLRTDVLALNTLTNQLRANLVTVGIIKGAA